MKKILFLSTILLLFSSCEYIDIRNDKGTEKKGSPQVEVLEKEGYIKITPESFSGIEYINIFRYETEGYQTESPIKKETAVNIGEIYIHNKDCRIFSFNDRYTSGGKYYKYAIRYKTSKEYIYSELSNKPVLGISNTSNPEKEIRLNTGITKLNVSLDEEQYVLSIPANTFTLPSTNKKDSYNNDINFDVMLAVSNSTVTNLLKMTKDDANNQYSLVLRSTLPSHFYDKELKVISIVGQWTEDVSITAGSNNADYKRLIWTKPLTTYLVIDNEEAEKFTITSKIESVTTMDYTPVANAKLNDRALFTADLSADTFYCDYN